MSGKKKKSARKVDRRVTRTRDVLGDALIALMQEKPWPEITVQHVLERAKVSRSTFYAHYSGKNDLFMSDVEDFFEMVSGTLSRRKERSGRVLPVRELCAHLRDVREFILALNTAGKLNDVWELASGRFARAIEEKLSVQNPRDAAHRRELRCRSHMLAGGLIALLIWWMDHGMRETPDQIDRTFHELVLPGAHPSPPSQTANARDYFRQDWRNARL
ncbi:MAG: TetR/AcrR family transcriptional regulator [Terriglobales bacterium]